MSRASELLSALRDAEDAYLTEKRQLELKHLPVLEPLRAELEKLRRRAKEIVEECGRDVVEARASWTSVTGRRAKGCTSKGYSRLCDVTISAKRVTVETEDYCGEGNYEAGAPITFPSQWLDDDSTHAARCAELRSWYAKKVAKIEAKQEREKAAAQAARDARDLAEYERLQRKFTEKKV